MIALSVKLYNYDHSLLLRIEIISQLNKSVAFESMVLLIQCTCTNNFAQNVESSRKSCLYPHARRSAKRRKKRRSNQAQTPQSPRPVGWYHKAPIFKCEGQCIRMQNPQNATKPVGPLISQPSTPFLLLLLATLLLKLF
jgi:hypothetical protein